MAGIKQSEQKHIILNAVSQFRNADGTGIIKSQNKDSNNKNKKKSNSNNGSNNNNKNNNNNNNNDNNNNNNNDNIVKSSLTGR